MAEVLVLVEHANGEVKKVTCELLTLARRFGEPAAVWIGAGADAGRAKLAEFGAAKVYVAGDAEFTDYVVAPLPAERPRATRALLESLRVLGTPELDLDVAAAAGFVTRFGETLTVYTGAGAMAHPGLHLDMANRALDRNMRMSPWIHVGSEGRHLSVARVGDRLAMRGRVQRLFEKKGHEFVEADLLLVANGTRPVASIHHTAIYLLRKAG